MNIEVRKREGLVFSGLVRAVSSYNEKGPFDVLPYHTNFISIIREEVVLYKTDGTEEKIPVDVGVLLVRENNAEAYLGVTLPNARIKMAKSTSS